MNVKQTSMLVLATCLISSSALAQEDVYRDLRPTLPQALTDPKTPRDLPPAYTYVPPAAWGFPDELATVPGAFEKPTEQATEKPTTVGKGQQENR
jgi:hypothetical protein